MKLLTRKTPREAGFTIVELLIVIVVIGILAAITIVAYNGIQNRANDIAIQSDMQNLGKKIELYYAEYGEYPETWTGLGMKASKNSYGAHYNNLHNLLYCRNYSVAAIAGGSKSGKVFVYKTGSGVSEYPGNLATNASLCPNLGVATGVANGWAATWYYSNGVWSGSV